MSGIEGLANAYSGGRDLQDLAGAGPGLADVLKGLFGPQRPAYGAPMADLVIRCLKRDPALSWSIGSDDERHLVACDRQQEVGLLLLALSNTVIGYADHLPGSAGRPNPACRGDAAAPPARASRRWLGACRA